MKSSDTKRRIRPSVLVLLVGAFLVVAAILWLTRSTPPTAGANPEAATIEAAPAASPAETVDAQAAPAEPAQPAPPKAANPVAQAPPNLAAPISAEQELKVYESAARAISQLANPEVGELAVQAGSPQQADSPQLNPASQGAQPITNGVQAYRESDRLRRQRVQEMRALRNVTIAEARRNQPKNP
jgi:hypothetical protein